MNTPKHTPAPWKVNSNNKVYGKVNDEWVVVAIAYDMPCIGEGDRDLAAERGMHMEQANARLIAAAPELLDALEKLTTAAENIGGENVTGWQQLLDACVVAEQVRLKIKGEA